MTRRQIAALGLLILLTAAGSLADKKKDKEDATTRSVEGVVTDSGGNPIAGAIVQLKNVKTLQVRSFVAQQDGHYYFHSLSTSVDYELKAESGAFSPSSKTLSSFDSRKKAILNFRLSASKK